MNIFRNIYTLLVSIMLLAFPCQAWAEGGDVTFSYDTGNATSSTWGTNKKENYCVAVHLDAFNFVGVTVKGVRVPLEGIKNISNLKVFLTKQLGTQTIDKKKSNLADILTQDAVVADGYVEVTFDTPYTITSDGVYVGYSFDLDALDETNLKPVHITTNTAEGGLFVYTSRTYRSWTDMSAEGNSTLQVILSGTAGNAAVLSCDKQLYGQVGQETSVELTLTNHGSAGVQSIDYTYELNGESQSAHLELADQAIGNTYGATANFSVSLPAVSTKGEYPLTLKLNKVNGVANSDPNDSFSSQLTVYTKLPVHRAVCEEYTGTWCGNCPRGFVALEVMNRLNPDFIGISYHNSDEMEIMTSAAFPSSVSGFPEAFLNREESIDPYYAYSNTGFGLDKAYDQASASVAPADIDVSAKLSDDLSKISVASNVTFPFANSEANYKVELIILADSLHGDASDINWLQDNYYAGYGMDVFDQPEFNKFTTGDEYVAGLYFNDVIIGTTRTADKDITLPAEIEDEKSYAANATFNVSDLINTKGTSLVQRFDCLRAVALLIDAHTGYIVNANKCKVTGVPEGISQPISALGNASVVNIYDLSGRQLQHPTKGVNIVRKSDGTTLKVLVK